MIEGERAQLYISSEYPTWGLGGLLVSGIAISSQDLNIYVRQAYIGIAPAIQSHCGGKVQARQTRQLPSTRRHGEGFHLVNMPRVDISNW